MDQVVSPRWPVGHPEREWMDAHLPPALGYDGFSEQLFPARPADWNQPLSSHRAFPSLRSPPSPLGAPLAQRVDFSLRGHKRPRAVPLAIAHEHPSGAPSRSRALAMGFCKTFQTSRTRQLAHLLRFSSFRPPRYRILPGERLTTGRGFPRGRHFPPEVFRAQHRPALLNKSSFQGKEPHATR